MNAEKLAFGGAVGKKKHRDRKLIREARRANWHAISGDARRALDEKRAAGN